MNRGKKVKQKKKHGTKLKYSYLALIMSMTMLFGCVAGGTIAWLIADTDPVVNTFSYGDIDLKLDETKVDEDGDPVDEDGKDGPDKTEEGNEYEIVPGEEYLKDPAVTVLAGNEACWLFVKVEEKGKGIVTNTDGSTTTYGFDDYLDYEVIITDPENNIEGWVQLKDSEGKDVEGVYYRYVGEDTDNVGITYEILKDNRISVLSTVTKEMLNGLDSTGAEHPSLTFTAYAVQYSGFEPEITQGATEATDEQKNAAALRAWKVVEEENTPEAS